ncbi:Squamous cell carcinoma antigen recognized by T-cells 3 [Chionoecetes opilio]|uniref:Squamous cell carcinoma antigen recognized by T-cells 3 n=1 Tax=Chionoecetes opilio TaxID=41210 RepID=A0A8J4XWK1_CHIOP|nr:Squamous cell carcinoma antigen recognized by T-cells 3 [Chionoecetes opilio]
MNRGDEEEEMDTAEASASDSDSDDVLDEERQKELWTRVKELRKQVEENSMYYDGHISLIATLRELFELEEARKAREKMSEVYPLTPGVRQGCVLAPSLFNACMDWVLDKVVDQSDCGASVGNTKITDLVFADDAVIFAESLEVLVMALEALLEEAKPLGLEVSWLKTKVQVFGDLLDEAVQSVHACGEDIEILESFTYLGSAVHNDGGSRQEVLRRIGIAHGVMDSLSGSIWRCRYLCRRTKIRIFKSLVIPVLLYGCETWTLNSDLKRRINAFELWLDWIRDEQKVCTTDEERQYVVGLFKRAVQDYTGVQVWVEYVMFMLGGGDMEATRQVGDGALTAAGTHVAEGVLVWQVVLLVEKQVYSGLQRPGAVLSEQETVNLEKQLHRIQSLYRRQMRVPLMNCDPDALQEEASEYFEEDIEAHMKEDIKKAHQRLKDKIPFEEELLKSQNETDKLAAYRRYIAATKESDNPAAVQSLYERAVLDLCLVPDLWEDYVTFVIHQFPGLDYVVLPVCERSQRNCPWSSVLCELHITALQMFAVEGEEKATAAKIKTSLEKGLACGLQVGGDATRMWMAYLIFLRRQIKWDQPHQEQLNSFREAAHQAITMTDKYFGDEGDVESRIPRFWSRIEAEFVLNCERAREIWNDIIMKKNNNFKKSDMWLEFINIERSFGSEKHCRKLFRRALERVWDGVEAIGLSYLHFEQETGDLESMEEFNKRYRDRMVIVNKKRGEDAAKFEAEGTPDIEKSRATRQKQRNSKQGNKIVPVKEYNKNGTSQSSSSESVMTQNAPKKIAPPPGFRDTAAMRDGNTEVKPAGAEGRGGVEPPPGFTGEAPQASKGSKRPAEEPVEAQAKKMKVEKQYGVLTKDSPLDEMCTLFISNLDFKTSEKDVIEFFKSCGEIVDFRLVKNYKCLSKGFGYLVFKEHESAVKGLDMDRSPLNGRPVFVSPYDPENHTHKFKYSTNLEKDKLFVSGLPLSMSENDIKKAFEPLGEIKTIRLVTFRNGHSKGLCYIDYYDAETAAKVQQAMHETEIGDNTISVLISNPSMKNKNEITAPKEHALGAGNRPKKADRGRGGGMFSLVPRALMQQPAEVPESASPQKAVKKMSNDDFRSMLMK